MLPNDVRVQRSLCFSIDRFYTTDKIILIYESDLGYLPELDECDDDYLFVPKVMTIEFEITGEKQHNLRGQYFGSACLYSLKLICLFVSKKHYVVLGQLLRFYLDRKIRLINLHWGIRFTYSIYVARYIANNTSTRQQFKHGDVKIT